MPNRRDDQLFRSIRKTDHFDGGRFVKKVLINSLVFTPISLAYGFIFFDDSISGAVYFAIAINFGIVISSTFDCRYKLDFIESNLIFGCCWGISLLIAVLIYPIIFGHPL